MSSSTDSEDRSATAAFSRVFEAFEPYGRSFQPDVPRRLLIYPTDAFGPGAEELSALLASAEDEDLERVFVSAAKPRDASDDPDLYVLAPLAERTYRHALDAWTIVPHAIYPPSGRWGLMTTSDGYVAAGGSGRFIERLLQGLGRDEDEMIGAWLDELAETQRGATDGGQKVASWAPKQLEHIVGPERAERALSGSHLIRRF